MRVRGNLREHPKVQPKWSSLQVQAWQPTLIGGSLSVWRKTTWCRGLHLSLSLLCTVVPCVGEAACLQGVGGSKREPMRDPRGPPSSHPDLCLPAGRARRQHPGSQGSAKGKRASHGALAQPSAHHLEGRPLRTRGGGGGLTLLPLPAGEPHPVISHRTEGTPITHTKRNIHSANGKKPSVFFLPRNRTR